MFMCHVQIFNNWQRQFSVDVKLIEQTHMIERKVVQLVPEFESRHGKLLRRPEPEFANLLKGIDSLSLPGVPARQAGNRFIGIDF
jgi:hypothetical protein